MMMLTQCVNFQSNSINFWPYWNTIDGHKPGVLEAVDPDKPFNDDDPVRIKRDQPASVSHCDWKETRDMVDWQAMVGTIPIEGESGKAWPTFAPWDKEADGVRKIFSLSVIISAHHNLVTYGVPFVNSVGLWTNPGPAKRFYAPNAAIAKLQESPAFAEDETKSLVKAWLDSDPVLDLAGKPGMAAWVVESEQTRGTPPPGGDHDVWNQWHSGSDGEERQEGDERDEVPSTK